MSRSTYSKLLPVILWTTLLILVFMMFRKTSYHFRNIYFALLIDNYNDIRLFFFLKDFSVKLPTTSGMRFASLFYGNFLCFRINFYKIFKKIKNRIQRIKFNRKYKLIKNF